MNNSNDKLRDLRQKINHLQKNKKNQSTPTKESGTSFGFKISTEIVAALVVGVGIGLLVDNYFDTKPFGLIIFFYTWCICWIFERLSCNASH